MVLENTQPRFATALRVLGFFIFLFSLQIIISFILIRETHLNQVEADIQRLSDRINQDLKFNNGTWDTTLYNSDPLTSVPNQSGTLPVYIITSDGFVIDRSQPIDGFLDISDFKHLSLFTTPNTIKTAANESWRILSRKIERNGQEYGIITTAYYNPTENADEIDEILKRDLANIDKEIEVINGEINTTRLDIRNTHFEVAFEVVTKYNKVLVNNGRTPTYIDSSYVQSELREIGFKTVTEATTNHEYRILSRTVQNDKGETVGLIIVGESIESMNQILRNYLGLSFIIGFLLTLPLSLLTVFILRKVIHSIFMKSTEERKHNSPKTIEFNKKDSFLSIDGNRIDIPYASNQYYLCSAIFSHPKKRWEQDELMEIFGEDFDSKNQRKVYDAALAVNKKSGLKLIIYQEKTFRLNPQFLQKIN